MADNVADDVVFWAARRSGGRAAVILDDGVIAGARTGEAMVLERLVARHGSKATLLLHDPHALALVERYGDDAVSAMVRHPGIAAPVVDRLGIPAARAMTQLGPAEGRMLAAMERSGELARLGRTEEILLTVERHGDRAMQFIWRNKGALAVGTVMALFLKDPEAAMRGAGRGFSVAMKPVATAIGHAVLETGKAFVPTSDTGKLGLAAIPMVAFVLVACFGFWLAHRRKVMPPGTVSLTSKPRNR
ncbi:MAG: hypothetical protein ABIK09_19735 [Pseudomonadota bacterium]